jgi:hypothetical protein
MKKDLLAMLCVALGLIAMYEAGKIIVDLFTNL